MNYFRDLTDDECKIYDSWINHESIKTGENLFNVSKPKTNCDRIRQMTDEELAELITNRLTCSMCCNNYEACITFAYCKDGVLEWLQTEAREDEQS